MTHTEYANALRRIADFVEVHPKISIPDTTNIDIYQWIEGKEFLTEIARIFGTCKKDYGTTYSTVKKDFGGIFLSATTYKEQVCERVVIGKKIVPEIIIPASLIPEHEEEIVEWKCPESLLASEEEELDDTTYN